ncbi:IclR family transcriptional regulator [Paracoccus sp. Z330]|uniref:IclR family transcriptional regulator n=1 Tax=Paracoccus onchidii TaxID=3017813 RepID=A0ABT4ZB77_9RHOB|nr:IclR family transcriptional regulator [Paracoccus onchidii]MDB6176402.1 IclR family transcriptional regulator [Paracoccus onchidii]
MDQQDTAPEPKKTPKVDSTLAKGLQILEALAQSKGPRGVSELSRELELTKSNVFRLLQTLSTLGYARPTDDKRYSATLKAWQVGRSVVEHFNLRDICAPSMQMLASKTGEAVYLAVPEGLNVVYIDKIDSIQPIRSWNPVSGSAPIHCVGTGKAILAANYVRMRDLLTGNLTRHTEHSITSIKAMDDEILQIRAKGYAIDTGEFRDQIRSYGAAICMPDGTAIAAFGVSVPEINLKDGDEEMICQLVRLAAESVSQQLGRS